MKFSKYMTLIPNFIPRGCYKEIRKFQICASKRGADTCINDKLSVMEVCPDHVLEGLQEKKKWAALEAEGLAKMGEQSKVFEGAAVAEAVEFAFSFLRDPLGDPEQKRKWLESLIKKQGSEREDVKVSLLVKKAAELDEAKAKAKELKTGGGLTPEMLEVIEKQLKLL
jgi:hypothetical protein